MALGKIFRLSRGQLGLTFLKVKSWTRFKHLHVCVLKMWRVTLKTRIAVNVVMAFESVQENTRSYFPDSTTDGCVKVISFIFGLNIIFR